MRGKHYIFDSEAGALHLADAEICDMIAKISMPMAETSPPGVDTELWAELYALQQAGQLFAPETQAAMQPEGIIKALCLHVAHDCNLRCTYCFAGKGDYASRGLMDAETAKQAIDFLIKHSGNRRQLEIDFFGGEPLMAWDTVMEAVNYAKQRGAQSKKIIRLTLTTNGLLLDDEKIDFINTEIDNIVLSLDGRQAIHDAVRKTKSGHGSYTHIVEKFQKLVSKRTKSYYIRGTFTAKNLDFAEDVLALRELGFKHVSIEPVVLPPEHELAIQPKHIPQIEQEYERLLDILSSRDDINFFHFNVSLERGPCAYKRAKGCGAGVEYIAITPNGEIYPCHQFVGNSGYKLGTLSDGLGADKHNFAAHNLYTRHECTQCWARYLCGGGCPAANVTAHGSIIPVYDIGCKLALKRFECGLARIGTTRD